MPKTHTRGTVEPLAITGAGVVSAAGLGLAALGDAIAGKPLADSPPADPQPGDYPAGPMMPVPPVDFTEHLGRKGLRHLDRTTKLGLLACKLALDGTGEQTSDPATGVVMGTSTGSIRSTAEFCRDTLVHDRPYLVDAGSFPNTVMNCCAGQIAIRYGLHGVNATLAGGQLSSLLALRYARNALVGRQSPRLLVGGVEELGPQSAWAWHLAGDLAPEAGLGEGCAVFAVSGPQETDPDGGAAAPAGDGRPTAPALAWLLACEVAYLGGEVHRGRQAEGLAGVIERAMGRSGVHPEEVDLVSMGAGGRRGLRRIEERAVTAALGRVPERLLRAGEAIGECYSAAGSLQLAALLGDWQARPESAGRVGLVTAVGSDGNAGCVVVRAPAPVG
ncbi:beta-ketoacyl synthase N-terminal-like domain-containing protein [Kitasatospora sp. NPDC004669]|uniref:beta-ketoacyl synthase N-terminal-like domain-containing protein n=1 Tax=Kitasatospora sp. NPDC004669 TaxID=3154555 RepID=UPI0033BE5A10